MLICEKCGMLFVDDNRCPSCGSYDVCETETCEICGKTVREGQLLFGVCEDCMKRESTVESAIAIGDIYPDYIEINSFVSYFLGQERINAILLNAVTNSSYATLQKDAERYCMDDYDALCKYIADKNAEPDGVRFYKRKTKKGER